WLVASHEYSVFSQLLRAVCARPGERDMDFRLRGRSGAVSLCRVSCHRGESAPRGFLGKCAGSSARARPMKNIRGLKAEDLVEDRIVRKLEKKGAF
ncbi:MAG TPA: hypothetical protein VFQ89_03280, partial [Candidatus Binatia bacterium]|nr:hypothetical protein [Candidatus Binatia bacterium]